MKTRILVVSSANIDFVQKVHMVPQSGETVAETEYGYSYVPGGKGANAAIALARVGADCIFNCRVGNDANGSRLKQLYASEGIDTRFIIQDKNAPTGLASIIVDAEGANRIIVYPGANENLSAEDVETAFTSYPDALFLQFEIPDEAILTAAEFANKNNIPIFVDAAPAKADFPLEKLGHVTVFSPNESETAIYTGIDPNNAENCLKACIRLSSMVDTDYIVLKLGGRGSYVYDGKFPTLISALNVNVVDTTAAGDTYTSTLVYDYLIHKDIIHAAKFANAAASLSVTRAGASTSIPTMAEILQFAEEHSVVL